MAATPALPGRVARTRRQRFELTTPMRLWVLQGAVAACALLAFAAVSAGVGDSARAFQTIGAETAPTINDALGIYFAVSDMDADAADYLLLNGASTGSVSPTGVLLRYEQRRQTASNLLVSAAHNPSYDAAEHTAILRIVGMVQIFDATTAQAETLNDHGDRVAALALYGQADDLMHAPQSGLLDTTLSLAASLHANLDARYDAARGEEDRDAALVGGALGLLIAALAILQLTLVRRTRRVLNPLLLVASALAMSMLIGTAATLDANSRHLTTAKTDGFDSLYALRQLRAIAFDAKADESRYLLDPSRAQFYEESYLDKSVELASFQQRVTILTYDAALQSQVAAVEERQPAQMGGAFGRALNRVVFPGEQQAAQDTLAAYARSQHDDRVLRADATGGMMPEAIRFDTSAAPDDAGGDLAAFDSALNAWAQIHQNAFDSEIAAGQANLTLWQVWRWLVPLLIVGLTSLGLRARLREYS